MIAIKIQPVKKERISEQVVDQLFKLIIKGNLRPGDRLPSERDLTKQFNVSRNSLREGIRILEMLGFLVSRRGDGTYIAEMDSEIFEGYLSSSSRSSGLLASEIIETRLIIEPSIARLAAQRRNSQQLKMLKDIVNEMEDNIALEKQSVSHDLVFHVTMAKASQNKILEDVLTFLMGYISDFLTKSYEVNQTIFPLRSKKMFEEHFKIYKAVETQDPDLAEELLRDHINNVREKIEKINI